MWDIRDFITEDFEQKVQNSFAKVTGYGIVFVDIKGNHIGRGSNFTKFCKEINSTAEGCAACAKSNREGMEIALKTNKPCIYICHAGLVNIIIPYMYEGCYIGALTAGQVVCQNNNFFRCSENLLDVWLKDPKLKAYYGELEKCESEKIEAMVDSLRNVQEFIFESRIRHEMETQLYEKDRELLTYRMQKSELERELKAAQFELLQKKIIPHFMFNILNSISRLICLDEKQKALAMLDSYAKMLRYQCSNTVLMVDLKEELDYIRNYLSIQNIRFDERVTYSIECSKELYGLKIPFFSLQPFVENSIEHGILDKPKGGRVCILCEKKPDCSQITIEDNGVGMDEREIAEIREKILCDSPDPPKNHVGIFNCCSRYRVVFGKRAVIRLESEKNKGTRVTIRLKNKQE